ncbi:hypothetical protein AB0M00_19515 [Streptomyces chartreusis]|uniref:hypothetical protein n=1 Tax=Streptomyces chartreusis TaxID=1969 RepID=UPI003438E616
MAGNPLEALAHRWFRRPVRLQGVELRTTDNAIVVAVQSRGVWRDLIVEPWEIREDDGSIGHSFTAGGIRAVLDGRRC